jgi:F0F1-type ATP synthase membrane subunit b/b'
MTIYYQDPRIGEKNQNSTDVLGDEATTPSQAPNQAPQPSQASAPAAPQAQAQTPQKAQNMPKQSPRSGMFTNTRQYIEKNKPKASQMAGAATQNLQKQASSIQQQADARKQALQRQLDTNRSKMEQDKAFAQQMVAQAGQQPAQATQPGTPGAQPSAQDDFARFRQIASGATQAGYGNVEDFNIAKQELAARQLAGQADRAETATGRREMLAETFGKDRAYTRGQSSLDELILGGDPAARQQMIQQTQEATEGLTKGLGSMRKDALANIAGLRREAEGVGEYATGLATQAQQDVKTAAEAEAQRRMETFGADQKAFEEALASGNVTADMLDRFIGKQQYQSMIDEARKRQAVIADYVDDATFGFRSANKSKRKADIAGLSRKELKKRRNEYIAQARAKGSNLTTGQLHNMFQEQIQADIKAQKITKDTIRNRLLELSKTGKLGQYLSGPKADTITAQNVASPEQLARYQALAGLAGKASDWLPEYQQKAATGRAKFKAGDVSGLYKNLIKV